MSTVSLPLRQVSDGANKKNLMPLNVYHLMISDRMLNGGLSSTTQSGGYSYSWKSAPGQNGRTICAGSMPYSLHTQSRMALYTSSGV